MTSLATKQQQLDELYAPYRACTACPLGALGRTNVVFGEGNPDARIMFIGEAPGRDEDRLARPFVGRSGQLLTKALEVVGIARDNVFISNVVKCRPPNNRTPLPDETGICKKLLLFNQIRIIQPRVICTLGSVALQGLLNREVRISQERGRPVELQNGIFLIPTFHPAYILRNASQTHVFVDDLLLAYSYSKK